MSDLVIEILTFAECPNAEQTRLNVREAVRHEGLAAEIAEIDVNTPGSAMSHRFLGSPSVRVNGKDVENGAEARHDYGLMCRTYHDGRALMGAPTVEMIQDAIKRQVGC
jgi:hypothetical protein